MSVNVKRKNRYMVNNTVKSEVHLLMVYKIRYLSIINHILVLTIIIEF